MEGKFVSNLINFSRRHLCKSEISYSFKGLKLLPAANKIDRTMLKSELEEYGRELRLMWIFRENERPLPHERFRPKSTFNPRNKDTVIKTYPICLEERLLGIDISSKRLNKLIKGTLIQI